MSRNHVTQRQASSLEGYLLALFRTRRRQQHALATLAVAATVFAPAAQPEPRKKGRLDRRSAFLLRRRLDTAEDWVVIDLDMWTRLRQHLLPELPPDSGTEGDVPPPKEEMCVFEGRLILLADLPDGWGVVAPQAPVNGAKRPRTIDGHDAPPPVAVRLQGPNAATREAIIELAGRPDDPEDDGRSWYNPAPDGRCRQYEDGTTRQGKAARKVRAND